jgi:hypothetical protein
MTEMRQPSTQQAVGVPRQGERRQPPEPTGWVGWILFAGVMMIMAGSLHVIAGLVALFKDEYFLVGKNGLTVSVDYTAWGWVHLIAGAIIGLAGFAVMVGQMWARVLAVVLAVASAIVNIGFLAAYPVWSAIIIALDVLVIYALTVHGREVKAVEY